MNYSVKSPILGFEDMNEVRLDKVDDMFVTLRDVNNENISLTLANPYKLREYSFDVPSSIRILLDINENSRLSVYNVVIIQSPLDESMVNFLAPLVFNEDNKTVAQIVLDERAHPDFKMAQSLKDALNS